MTLPVDCAYVTIGGPHLLASLVASSGSDQVYTVVYVLVGVLGVLGVGGLASWLKWAKRQGVRDAQLDQVIAVVLPDAKGKGGLNNRFDAQDRKLEDIARQATPNGGKTQRLGDVATRTEGKVDNLATKLDQHIGQEKEIHSQYEDRFQRDEQRIRKLEETR